MSRRFLVLLALMLLVLASGCRRHLRYPMEVDARTETQRARFAKAHPDDPFLDAIGNREIHNGMSRTHVYLSWGRPMHRSPTEQGEHWVYEYEEDPDIQPRKIVHLFFREDTLVRWRVDRGYVFMGQASPTIESFDDIRDCPGEGGSKSP